MTALKEGRLAFRRHYLFHRINVTAANAESHKTDRDRRYADAAFFAALAALAFARFATSAALRSGDIFFFTAVFFGAAFFEVAPCLAWNAAQRFFCAAAMRLRAATLRLRLRTSADTPKPER